MEINSFFLLIPSLFFLASFPTSRPNILGKSILVNLLIITATTFFLTSETSYVFIENWFYNYDLAFQFNKINIALFFLTATITAASSFFVKGYLTPETPYYWRAKSFFLIGMQFLLFGGNLLMKFIGWEFLGIASFLLISYFRNDEASKNAMISLWINRIGDMAFLLGLVMFSEDSHENLMLGTVFLLAAMTKSAQIPFHSWLSKAMSAPTTISALFHSATVVAAGVYLLYYLDTLQVSLPLTWIFWIGTATIFLAGTTALLRKNAKTLLADSTISQLGFMFVALATQDAKLAVYYLVAHAIFKAGLFLSLIFIYKSEGNYLLKSRVLNRPEFAMVTLLAFALAGIPGFASSKIKSALLEHFPKMKFFLLLAGIFLTSAYTFRFLKKLFPPHSACPTKKDATKYLVLLPLILFSTSLLFFVWRFPYKISDFQIVYYEIGAILLGALFGIFLARNEGKEHLIALDWEHIFKGILKFSLFLDHIEHRIAKSSEKVLIYSITNASKIFRHLDEHLDESHKNVGAILLRTGKILLVPSQKHLRFYITTGIIIFAGLLLLFLLWN